MGTGNIDETVDGQAGPEDGAERGASERRSNDDGTPIENSATSDNRKDGSTWPGLNEKETRLSRNKSARFDPKFNLERTPAIALLCQVCHTALLTASSLSSNETHGQKLALGALRVRIWGMDLFDPTQCTPLDELLSLSALGRGSLRRHLTGVWADIAATLEIILRHLITQTDEASQETCTQWTRLRIVLGHEDIAPAVHDGFGPPGSSDSDSDYTDDSKILEGSINSLEGLIDCLFDLSVTIGTIRQLDKLGFKPAAIGSSTFCDNENKAYEGDKEAKVSSTRSSSTLSWVDETNATAADGDWRAFSTRAKEDKKKGKIKAEPINESATTNNFLEINLDGTPKLEPSFRDVGTSKDKAANSSSGRWGSWSQDLTVKNEVYQNSYKPQTLFPGVSVHDLAEYVSRGTQYSALDAVPREVSDGKVKFSRAATHHGLRDQGAGFGERRDLSEDTFMYNNARKQQEAESLRPVSTLASSQNNLWSRKPIKFIDDYERIFAFPFEVCRTWKGMQGLIKEAFMGMTGPDKAQIKHGKYDLLSHDDNEIIVPSLWESMIAPGMTIKMHLYAAVPSDVQAPYQEDLHYTNYNSRQSEKQPKSVQKDVIGSDEHRRRSRSRSQGEASHGGRRETSQDDDTTPTASASAKRSGKAPIRPSPPPVISRDSYHRTRMLPQFPSLPNFEDIGIEKQPQYPEPSNDLRKDYLAPAYHDSAYFSAHPSVHYYSTAGKPLSYSSVDYANHSGIPSTMATMPESQGHLPISRPVPTRHRSNMSTALPFDLSRDKVMRDLFNQGIQQVRDAAIKETESKYRTRADFEQFIVGEGASQTTGITAEATQRFDREEAEAEEENKSMEVETREHDAAAQVAISKGTIQFIDALERHYTFPIHLCSTWKDMEDLIVGIFRHIDGFGTHIIEGRYDLIDSSGDILLPSLWEELVEPGWKIKMQMWPFTEQDWAPPVQPPEAPQSSSSNSSDFDAELLPRSNISRWKERILGKLTRPRKVEDE